MGLSVRGEFKLVDVIHILQFIIIHGILGVCGYRILQKSKIRTTRGDMMAMSMGAKSLFFIFWVVGTERVGFLKRFYSLKTNMILMTLEPIFWVAVVFLSAQSLVQRGCAGIGCTLSYIVIGLSSAMLLLSLPVAFFAIRHFRMHRKTGVHPKEQQKTEEMLRDTGRTDEYKMESSYKS